MGSASRYIEEGRDVATMSYLKRLLLVLRQEHALLLLRWPRTRLASGELLLLLLLLLLVSRSTIIWTCKGRGRCNRC